MSDKYEEILVGPVAESDVERAKERLREHADHFLNPRLGSFVVKHGELERDIDKLLSDHDRLTRELREKEDAARNLLAVMHRDGGHHTEAVGFVQSCKDAENVRHDLLGELDRADGLRAEVADLRAKLAAAEAISLQGKLCISEQHKDLEARLAELQRENERLRGVIAEIRREVTGLFDRERPGMTLGLVADLCDSVLVVAQEPQPK